ncbi:2017_t:CDS:2 [Scutellospora calospora]|uniref:2017_t:CDS:1 n=1 Tax=Scutellospora calospora TaxID=85575 RepID=A0ACA9KZN8_9GLOM|nr:2017_t:CDS:2 [Scutellospora calospora]
MSSFPTIYKNENLDHDIIITNDNDRIDTTSPSSPLLPSNFNSNAKLPSYYRWLILLGFSLLTLSSACLWITFAPCLYIFMSYFSQTPSSINSLSSVYMIMFPILLIPSIKFFNKYGIKTSIIFGAFLNALGAFLRYLGTLNKSYIGFWILFLGQTIDSIAQLFMLSVPSKLANIWFSEFGEQNFATSVGVTANSAGVAIGHNAVECERTNSLSTTKPSDSNISYYLNDRPFMILTLSYGIVTGGEYALSTLLSQMILPVFKTLDEVTIINYQKKKNDEKTSLILYYQKKKMMRKHH